MFKKTIILALLTLTLPANGEDIRRERTLEQITVIGSRQAISDIPGSAFFISEKDLSSHEYTDIMRVLSQVPGIYLMEEDGYGLRPNIGMRGTGLSRNDKITVMEDGVLAAPAAYAAPSAYYFPTIGRMQSVEALKGTSAVMYGPRTTGGVLNLVSRSIPDADFAGEINLSAGQDGFGKMHVYAGGEKANLGALLEIYRYQADGFKRLPNRDDTGFTKNDVLAKVRVNSDRQSTYYQELELKLKYSDEVSNETYLGLIDADFDENPYRRYAASQEDRMTTDHQQVQLSHYIQLGLGVEINSVIYYNNFHRNWYKTTLDANTAAAFENTTANGNLDFMVKANNRDYISRGIQSQVRIDLANHSITAGIRYHEDEMDRFQWQDSYQLDQNLVSLLVASGIPGTDSNRIDSAQALALFIHDEIALGDWVINAGVRFEDMSIHRRDWGKQDPSRSSGPLKRVDRDVTAVTPALGATYRLSDEWILLAGIQKGFAPPAAGNSLADEERSWNYEAGVRFQSSGFNTEVIGFYGDYDNMHGNCTAAQGCSEDRIGDQFNAGKVAVKGLEVQARYSIEMDHFNIPWTLAYTYTTTEFKRDFSADFEAWGDVQAGDELPYIPEQQVHLSVGIESDLWSLDLGIRYLNEMRTRAGQGAIEAGDLIASHTVVDLAASYQISKNQNLYLTVDNLLDKIYAATRTHNSLQPGKPRSLILGYKYRF